MAGIWKLSCGTSAKDLAAASTGKRDASTPEPVEKYEHLYDNTPDEDIPFDIDEDENQDDGFSIWLETTVANAISLGFTPIPKMPSGKFMPFGDGESYPADAPEWRKAIGVSLRLDHLVLLDMDGNKGTPAHIGEIKSLPNPFQWNDEKNSIHWLFKMPEVDFRIKQSADGFAEHWDLKTGNQLVHLKPHKTIGWVNANNFPDCPLGLVENLKIEHAAKTDALFEIKTKPSLEKVVEMLQVVHPDKLANLPSTSEFGRTSLRELTLKIMFAVHDATDGSNEGREIFDQWAAQSALDQGTFTKKNWAKASRRQGTGVGFGTLAGLARELGWKGKVIDRDPSLPRERSEIATTETADEFDVSDIDIMNPPSEIASCILAEMASREFRHLPEANVVGMLQTLKNACPQRTDANGTRINLVTLVIGLSGAGKDMPQQYTADKMDALGFIGNMSAAPRSDKDLITTLLENRGHCIFTVDEGHSFFTSTSGRNASAFSQNIVPELLKMTSGGRYLFSPKLKRDLLDGQTGLRAQAKKLEADYENGRFEDDAVFEKLHGDVTWMIETLEGGMKDPCVSLSLSSTPVHMDNAVDQSSLEDGFLARALVFRGNDERAQSSYEPPNPRDLGVNDLLKASRTQIRPKMNPAAQEMMKRIHDYFESDERLNHPILGALYARGRQRIDALASLVALGEPKITPDHIRYALKLFTMNIDAIKTIIVERAVKDSDGEDEGAVFELIKQRVAAFTTKHPTKAKSAIKQQVFKIKSLDSDNPDHAEMFDEIWADNAG